MGPWHSVSADPGQWAVGNERRCDEFVVHDANQRLRHLRRVLTDREPAPLQPLRPRIWPARPGSSADGAQDGLTALEHRWTRAAEERGRTHAPPAAARAATAGGRADPEYAAAWMRPPPPRLSRAQCREAAATWERPRPPRRPPDAGDAVDVLRPPGVEVQRPPWAHVWATLRDPEIDRTQRALAWRILHGCLFVGGYAGYVGCRPEPECACPHAPCGGALQTLTHTFLHCAIARPVLAWLARLWTAVTGGPPPLITAATLLADDRRTWQPEAPLRALWLRLRLATLQELWRAAQPARLGQAPVCARVVAAKVVYSCRAAAQRDWVVVRADIAAACGVPADWLRGREPKLTLDAFRQRWCHRGVLMHAGDGATRLDLRWSADFPVPVVSCDDGGEAAAAVGGAAAAAGGAAAPAAPAGGAAAASTAT
ncbi:MAG TPA: hypothetical protein VGC15_17995 [Acetobacteraceae bacterium]